MSLNIDSKNVWTDIQAIKKNSPLIHNITNYVVMEQTANSLLALGASPVMAHASEEVEEITAISNGLVLNIGTLSSAWIKSMQLALRSANKKGIPVVLDPVGSGASSYRTSTAIDLLKQGNVTVIRGNASEIASLSEKSHTAKGVDSRLNSTEYVEQANRLAVQYQCVVWMSGKVDVVTNGKNNVLIHNGHPLMGKVTGMGCTASALTAAFLAINADPLHGSMHAAFLMGIAGEKALAKGDGPGTIKTAFIDALYKISLDDIAERIRYEKTS